MIAHCLCLVATEFQYTNQPYYWNIPPNILPKFTKKSTMIHQISKHKLLTSVTIKCSTNQSALAKKTQ